MKTSLLFAFGFFALSFGNLACAEIQTVPQVDPAKFVGTWYRISANPIPFEPNCACAQQILTPTSDGKIAVFNSCNKNDASGPLTEIRGTASAEDSSYSKLAVDFGLPWKGQYWIIAVDAQYRYAVVTDNLGFSLYIMSKTPQLDSGLYAEALAAAKTQVNTDHLVMQNQNACTYPSAN